MDEMLNSNEHGHFKDIPPYLHMLQHVFRSVFKIRMDPLSGFRLNTDPAQGWYVKNSFQHFYLNFIARNVTE
jgi:hypothetical protein